MKYWSYKEDNAHNKAEIALKIMFWTKSSEKIDSLFDPQVKANLQ